MVKIEVLFSEVCNLYGDLFNIKMLNKSIKETKCYYTTLTDTPKFVTEDIDLIYMAPMTEKTQEMVIEKLKPYTKRIKELIDKNKVFLLTGNALEIFGKYIENEDGTRIQGLNLFDIYAKRRMMDRYNSLFLGTIEENVENDEKNEIKIVGFKAQFSMSYGNNEDAYAFKVIRGSGINKESQLEGIRKNNFFGTYVLGPILVMNPLFTKYIIKLLGEEPHIAFEEEAMNAYNIRLKEFENPHTEYEE